MYDWRWFTGPALDGPDRNEFKSDFSISLEGFGHLELSPRSARTLLCQPPTKGVKVEGMCCTTSPHGRAITRVHSNSGIV